MRYEVRAVIDTTDRDPETHVLVQPTGPEVLVEFTNVMQRWSDDLGDVYFELVRCNVWEVRPGYGIDIPKPDTTELRRLVRKTERLAEGDSNDDEIQALQEALWEACALLGLEDDGAAV